MKTLIVTGGTGGLGTAVLRSIARDYHCVVLYRSERSFAALRSELPDHALTGIEADLEDEESVTAALEQATRVHGAPYGLVHMAGGFAAGKLSATDGAAWAGMMSLNVTSAMFVIRETLRHMDRTKPGRIVAISSEATRSRTPGTLAYTVSKQALNTLVEIVAAELAGSQVTANALLPSSMATPAMLEQMPAAKLVPLERVASTILYLLSGEAGSVNGALIPLTP